MACEKSAPKSCDEPRGADLFSCRRSANVISPVPQQRSSTRVSGRNKTSWNERAARLHHTRSTLNESTRKILARLQTDKKTQNGVVHFILPREIGKVEVATDVPQDAVLQAVDELRQVSHTGWGK